MVQAKTVKQGINKAYQKVHVKCDVSYIKLVDKILTAKKQHSEADTTKLESEIDWLVYELYGLSEEEVGVVGGIS